MLENKDLEVLNKIKNTLWNMIPVGIFSLIISINLFFNDYIKILKTARGKGIVLFICSISIFFNYFKTNKMLNRIINKIVKRIYY
jgi:hypothetical protein